jgi:predicted DNA-binding ribbon-helix-helix protein
VKRSISIAGQKSSVSLEDAFWQSLKEIAATRSLHVSHLVDHINAGRVNGNLSSAIRLFVLGYYRTIDKNFLPSSSSSREEAITLRS